MTAAQRTSELAGAHASAGTTVSTTLASKEKRASALRAAKDQGQAFSSQDQERAASNLHLLLQEVSKTRGLTKREVVVEAGLGGGVKTDSTKRLDTYTLPEGANEARKNRLAKKPGKYFEIAAAIANLLNEPPAPFICQVFEGCTFGADHQFLTSWEEEKWARLAQQLRMMGLAVARQTKVDAYWSEANKRNGFHDYRNDRLLFAAQAIDSTDCSTGLAGYTAHPADIPPVPSVLLGTKLLAGKSYARLCLSDRGEKEVVCTITLEVRLALAPVGRTGEPGPMLEFRSSLNVTNRNDGETIITGAYFDEVDGALEISGAGVAGGNDPVVRIEGLELPEAPYRYGCGHECWTWEEINPGLLQELFGDWESPLEMTYTRSMTNAEAIPPSRFEAGSAAFVLNAHLLTHALEAELTEACRDRANLLAQFCDAVDEQILRAEADAETRWRNMHP